MACGNVSTPPQFHYAGDRTGTPARGGETDIEQDIGNIHDFWFGELDSQGLSPPDRQRLWFGGLTETDALCRQRFGSLCECALGGGLQHWEDSDAGLVALLLLLDQFPRNIHRGSPRAFAGDARARALSREWVEHGHYQRLPAIHQVFLYMPLEHSEDLDDQDTCVALFAQLAATTGSDQVASFSRYAAAHREVIARFGRFPHRNALLGRESSAGELAWLDAHGGF
ncbi:DUF924 family protein [Haliea sp. E17]|uniref:DUF924 family protein n=1 Tax=Haliea sp. E17 TaxID=3401576 RepID=UPI003AAEB99B